MNELLTQRMKLTVAYDGTDFHGFAKQNNAISVQEMLEAAVFKVTGQNVEVIGSGRTDAGVHANAQCCVIDVMTRISPKKMPYALNSKLPLSIRVTSCEIVEPTFHPRFDTKQKTYRYSIYNGAFMTPFNYKYTMHHSKPLDIGAMRQAGQYLVGTHDFKSFCSTKTTVQSTIRTIFSLEIQKVEDMIYIDICGNGFLYNMVRIIVGTLIQVGEHKRLPESVKEILQKKDRTCAGPTAEAKGLMMYAVDYS
jgi:tRNA pseudouridine38-40 synthase